ncbi:hypothetical protein D3C72_1775290 [compost metagenome]
MLAAGQRNVFAAVKVRGSRRGGGDARPAGNGDVRLGEFPQLAAALDRIGLAAQSLGNLLLLPGLGLGIDRALGERIRQGQGFHEHMDDILHVHGVALGPFARVGG